MNFSLINVDKEYDGYVDGTWMQDCSGTTLENATKRARDTENVNSHKITVAVVASILAGSPNYSVRKHLERLDIINKEL